MMNRRAMLASIAGAASLPLAARAQQGGRLPVIGYYSNRSAATEAPIREPFLKALAEQGFEAGRNVALEYRFGLGDEQRLPAIAAELVQRGVTMLVTTDRGSAAAAKAVTAEIPIVFTSGFDPVQLGLVQSFSRPGGNATGLSILTSELGPKRLGLLRELLPKPGLIAFAAPPKFSTTASQVREMQGAAQALGQALLTVDIGSEAEAGPAFAMMAERKVAGLLYSANTFYQVIAAPLVELAARHRIPAIYEWREFVEVGGLMSYSTDRKEFGRIAGTYAGRILRGERPADLPIVQSRQFELVINLKTAKALELDIPAHLITRADEVIE